MEETAEEVCDDHVVHWGADRSAYANALMRLAEQPSLPFASVVPLVAFRSLLGQRVQRILDRSHQVSLRAGMLALCPVFVAGIGLTVLMGLVGCGPNKNTSAQDEQAGSRIESAATPPNSTPVRGKVTMPDGKPAAGAHVALIARRRQGSEDAIVLAQGRCDASGGFNMSASNLSSARYMWVQLLARSADTGLGWQDVSADAPQQDVTIKLPHAAPTRGRLVTLEGQPAKGVHLRVGEIFRSARGKYKGVFAIRGALPAEIWPSSVTSDADGWYTVPGLPEGVQVGLHVEQEPYAADDWPLDSGATELTKQIRILPPAQIIEGIVVAADTGQPLADARVSAMTQQSPSPGHGLMSVYGKTDGSGRFRLNPFASKSYLVVAMGPVGVPYLAKQLDIQWSDTAQEHQLRMKLPRGVLVKGTIVEEPDGQPLADATVRYTDRIDNKYAKDIPLIGRFQPTVLSDEQGRFTLAVPAGAGHLTVESAGGGHVLEELEENKLTGRNIQGGPRLHVSAHAPLDLPADAREHTVHFEVRRALTARGEVVGANGGEAASKSDSAMSPSPAAMPRKVRNAPAEGEKMPAPNPATK